MTAIMRWLWGILPWKCRDCGERYGWGDDRTVRARSGRCCFCEQVARNRVGRELA